LNAEAESGKRKAESEKGDGVPPFASLFCFFFPPTTMVLVVPFLTMPLTPLYLFYPTNNVSVHIDIEPTNPSAIQKENQDMIFPANMVLTAIT
jgi:hypothetical protein